MQELRQILDEQLNENMLRATLSGRRRGGIADKIKIHPVSLRGELHFQTVVSDGKKEFHKNYLPAEMAGQIVKWLEEDYKQLQMDTTAANVTALVSKKGKATVKVRRLMKERPAAVLAHNRRKRYILEEGTPVPFLVDLGVMTKEGKVVRSRYDKFRQINRFLEFVEDVIETCSALAKKYGYDKLEFQMGDIASYEGESAVDMVVTLHACDTATDYALEKAVKWGANVILCVPCCQHELNGQIKSKLMEPVLKYGLIRERMAALLTDAFRANLLEEQGYQVQVLEFIDMEHTPKNILIRAVRKTSAQRKENEKLADCMRAWNAQPLLDELLRGTK